MIHDIHESFLIYQYRSVCSRHYLQSWNPLRITGNTPLINYGVMYRLLNLFVLCVIEYSCLHWFVCFSANKPWKSSLTSFCTKNTKHKELTWSPWSLRPTAVIVIDQNNTNVLRLCTFICNWHSESTSQPNGVAAEGEHVCRWCSGCCFAHRRWNTTLCTRKWVF